MSDGIRVTSKFTQSQVMKSMQSAQADLAKVSKQMSSGQKSDNFIGLLEFSPTENYLDMRHSKSKVDSRLKNNILLDSKLSEMDRAVMGIKQVASEAQTLIQRTRDPVAGNNIDTVGLAKIHLDSIKSYLSSQYNGQYLFAGSRYTTAPVGDIANVSNLAIDTPTGNYYLGDSTIVSSRISDQYELEYGILADDPAFQNLIGSLNELINGRNNNDPTKFDIAINYVKQANDSIDAMISRIGTNQEKVETQIKMDELSQLKLTEGLAEIEDTDVLEATQKLMLVQTQLQASFTILTRINSFSLADYLK